MYRLAFHPLILHKERNDVLWLTATPHKGLRSWENVEHFYSLSSLLLMKAQLVVSKEGKNKAVKQMSMGNLRKIQ